MNKTVLLFSCATALYLGCGDDTAAGTGGGTDTDSTSSTTDGTSRGTTSATGSGSGESSSGSTPTSSTGSASSSTSQSGGTTGTDSGDTDVIASTGDPSGTGGLGVSADVDCDAFCERQAECGDIELQSCVEQCESVIGFMPKGGESEACAAVVEEIASCYENVECKQWPSAMDPPDGNCFSGFAAQQNACNSVIYFSSGWESCVAHCDHAITECDVEVTVHTGYDSYEDCFATCITNSGFDVDGGCFHEGEAVSACMLDLECGALESFLNGDGTAAPACDQLGLEWIEACNDGGVTPPKG
jgi:hypothetical protein